MIRLARADLQRLSAWAEEAWPQEACALVVGRPRPGGVVDIVRLERSRNLSPEPEQAFEIDLGLRMGLERELRDAAGAPGRQPAERLVGLWHSHPEGPAQPSEADRAAVAEDLLWLLTGMAGGRALETRAFRPLPAGREPVWIWARPAAGFLPQPLVIVDSLPAPDAGSRQAEAQ